MKEDYSKKHISIKQWAEEDKPREKLLLKGKNALSNAELVAILINSGTSKISALDLSKIILNSVGDGLDKLAMLSAQELMDFKGIGEAKAIRIVSALELGRRYREKNVEKKPRIQSSLDAYQYLSTELSDLDHEQFWVLLLNRANDVITKIQISVGGVSGTIADPKIIFNKALQYKANSIILAHNHPSGNTNPSQADLKLTKQVTKAGEFLEIDVLDHLIIGRREYLSFADENLMS